MGKWEGLNRRTFPRVIYPCLISIKYIEGEEDILLSHTENVGIGGICIIAQRQIKRGTVLDLEIDLLEERNNIRCKGKVVWSIRRKQCAQKKPLFYDTGIEFVDLKGEDQKHVEFIVQEMAKRGATVPYV